MSNLHTEVPVSYDKNAAAHSAKSSNGTHAVTLDNMLSLLEQMISYISIKYETLLTKL